MMRSDTPAGNDPGQVRSHMKRNNCLLALQSESALQVVRQLYGAYAAPPPRQNTHRNSPCQEVYGHSCCQDATEQAPQIILTEGRAATRI